MYSFQRIFHKSNQLQDYWGYIKRTQANSVGFPLVKEQTIWAQKERKGSASGQDIHWIYTHIWNNTKKKPKRNRGNNAFQDFGHRAKKDSDIPERQETKVNPRNCLASCLMRECLGHSEEGEACPDVSWAEEIKEEPRDSLGRYHSWGRTVKRRELHGVLQKSAEGPSQVFNWVVISRKLGEIIPEAYRELEIVLPTRQNSRLQNSWGIGESTQKDFAQVMEQN